MNRGKYAWTKRATSIFTSMLLVISYMLIMPITQVKADDNPNIGINTSAQLSAQMVKPGTICKGQDINLNYAVNPYGSVNETRNPLDVVLVFDASGSMLYDNKAEYSIDAAKHFLHTLAVNSVPDVTDKAGIVVFANNAYKTKDLYSIKDNEQWFYNTIDSMQWGGWTNMSSGLTGAIDLLKNESGVDKYVIVLTDGYPNYLSRNLSRRRYEDYYGDFELMTRTKLVYDDSTWDAQQEAVDRITTLNSLGAKTYAIGLATSQGDIDSGYINRLAATGGTKGVVTSDVNDLDSIYNNIAKKITSSYQYTNMKINQKIPDGFVVKSLPAGWSQVGNNIVGNVSDVTFVNKAGTPKSKEYNVILTANNNGSFDIPQGTLNYTKPDGGSGSSTFDFGKIDVEDQVSPNLNMQVSPDKNQCLVGDPVTVTTTATATGYKYNSKITDIVMDQDNVSGMQKTILSSANEFGPINYNPNPDLLTMSTEFQDIFTSAGSYNIANKISYYVDGDAKEQSQSPTIDVKEGIIRVCAKSPTGKGIKGLNVLINGVVQPNKTDSNGYVECSNMKTDNYTVSIEVPSDMASEYKVRADKNPQNISLNYDQNDQTLTFPVDQIANNAKLNVSYNITENKLLVGDEVMATIDVTPTGSEDGVTISNITLTPESVDGVKNTDVTLPADRVGGAVTFGPTPDKGKMTNTYVVSFTKPNTTDGYSLKYDLQYDIYNGTTNHKVDQTIIPNILVRQGKINVNVSGTKVDGISVQLGTDINNVKDTGLLTDSEGNLTIDNIKKGFCTVTLVPPKGVTITDNTKTTANEISYDNPEETLAFATADEKPTISNCSLTDSKGNTNFVITAGKDNENSLLATCETDKLITNGGIHLEGLVSNVNIGKVTVDGTIVDQNPSDLALGNIQLGTITPNTVHKITIDITGKTNATKTSVNATVTFDKVIYDSNKTVDIDSSMISPNCTNVVNMVIIPKDLRLGFAK